MGRPKKPEVGSEKWARKELAIAENRLRLIRQRIAAADEDSLPSLLRLEAALRREVERLARAAQPTVLTDWYAPSRELERTVLEEDDSDD